MQLLKAKRPKQPKNVGLSKFAIRRAEARRSDGRGQDRHQVHGTLVRVTYKGRTVGVKLLNLSGGGAMLGCDLQPNVSDRIDLHFDEADTIESMARWVKNGRIGVEFAHETRLDCSEDEQAELLRAIILGSSPPEPSSSEAPDKSDARGMARHPFIWSAELLCGPHSDKVRLRNISPGGALVESDRPLTPGAEAILDFGEEETVGAIIKWSLGDCIGLQFDEPFDLRALAKFKPRSVPRTWSRPPSLEKSVHSRSAWDQAWNRMSPEDLREQLEGFLKR